MDFFKKRYSPPRVYEPVDREDDEDPLVTGAEKRPGLAVQKEPSANYWKAFAVSYLVLTILAAVCWLVAKRAECTCKPFTGYGTEFGRFEIIAKPPLLPLTTPW